MKFLVNITNTDNSYASAPANFLELSTGDYFIFSKGDVNVANGLPIPTSDQLNQAMTILPISGDLEISKIFIADVSANIIREIYLSGWVNKIHVFCISFDEPTATEPVLELWDDSGYDSYLMQILGLGTPANSKIKAIVTTDDNAPGDSWVGQSLAGGTDINRLLLNGGNGKLLAPKDLYFNLYANVNSSFSTSLENPVFLVKTYQTP